MALNYTNFKGIQNIGDATLTEEIESNLKTFFDWAFLNQGAFFSVMRPQTGAYGGIEHVLLPVKDPNYDEGQVWQTFRQNWVWETGVGYSPQPINISGIYVSGTFYSLNNSIVPYVLDYINGRVIFNNPINITAAVEMNYSFKWVNVQTADADWYRQVQANSFRADSTQFTTYGTGNWDQPPQMRVQLPAIIIDADNKRTHKGYELGGGQYVYHDVEFNVLAESRWMRNKLVDILCDQNEKRIYLFDLDVMAQSGAYPLGPSGNYISGSRMYPGLINDFAHMRARFTKTERHRVDTENTTIFPGLVMTKLEIVNHEI